ncbi:hypothetical protein HUJ04_009659 [Dendroctonus ponderosae]|nr:hypothetical protein HUJ04_009659 [Dendroctonus ponderosae]
MSSKGKLWKYSLSGDLTLGENFRGEIWTVSTGPPEKLLIKSIVKQVLIWLASTHGIPTKPFTMADDEVSMNSVRLTGLIYLKVPHVELQPMFRLQTFLNSDQTVPSTDSRNHQLIDYHHPLENLYCKCEPTKNRGFSSAVNRQTI